MRVVKRFTCDDRSSFVVSWNNLAKPDDTHKLKAKSCPVTLTNCEFCLTNKILKSCYNEWRRKIIKKTYQCLSTFTDNNGTNSYFIFISRRVEIISWFSDSFAITSGLSLSWKDFCVNYKRSKYGAVISVNSGSELRVFPSTIVFPLVSLTVAGFSNAIELHRHKQNRNLEVQS